ncbi:MULTISPECIES: J domain-containing protein [unclassified Legionella]|uniref:J domain-containing protein n=1 Tax=unclassified Legionella TaxID=2622702 RepID=UPI00105520B4|nr:MULTISPECIES: J domain-containing protein [unclassified Legionella]MDI9818045.1 J domain-containing protein [Legionella sp. PL877]
MKLREITESSWLYCDNEHAAEHSNYKLHAALPITNFDTHQARIYQLLKKAVEDGLIPGFKILNIGDSSELEKAIGGKEITIDKDPRSRLFNNPFTIYLYEGFDSELIASLIKQLESVTSDVPACTREHLSVADLDLTDHITFRQEKLNGEYIKIAGAGSDNLQALKKEGERSSEYQALSKACQQYKQANQKNGAATEKEEKEKQKENLIRGFYNANYNYFDTALQSEEINKQFQAACDLLKIDFKHLSEKKTEGEWLAIIKAKYRQAVLLYHPDKITETRFSDSKEKAQRIFEHVQIAFKILEDIAKNPTVLDKKKILEQQNYLPQYQYELRDGFVDDPYFYRGMAETSAVYFVIQNWEFEQAAERLTVATNASNQTSVQLYKPQLKVFKPHQREAKPMPGYMAFYHLFMANALPRRFDQGHFRMIFPYDDKPFNSAQTWLVKKVLTTPEFIGFMDSSDVIALAIKATKQGILNIGITDTDVFIYYYNHYPEILYGRRIEKWIKGDEFDSKRASEAILAQPQNLSALYDTAMAELTKISPEIREYILSNKELTAKLPIYYLNYQLLWPFFKTKESVKELHEIQDIKHVAIRQLLFGNTSFLPFFSRETLEQLKVFIRDNKKYLPVWLIDEIEMEVEQRDGRKDIVKASDSQIQFWNGYENPVQARHFIKKTFITVNPQVTFLLNKEALLWLASEPETHWSGYLPIAEALLALGEDKLAERYLLRLANELELENKDAKTFCQEIKEHKEKIDAINQAWKQNTINDLVEEYRKIIFAEKEGDQDAILDRLCLFNAGDKVTNIKSEYVTSLKNQFYDLVDRLKSGEKTEELKQAFISLRGLYARYLGANNFSYGWNSFVEKDRDGRWLIGGEIFTLMYQVLGVEDNNAILWGREHENVRKEGYGVKQEADLFSNLEQLYYVYECLSSPEKFYEVLQRHTSEKQTQRFVSQTSFNRELIAEHLLAFADNELAVFAKGHREAANYKTHRFVDSQNIKEFSQLRLLYKQLGQEKHLEDYLPNVYQQIMESEKRYRNYSTGGANYGSYKPDSNRPLIRYIAIRRFYKATHPQLEELAVQHQLYLLIGQLNMPYRYGRDNGLNRHEKKLVALWNKIEKTYEQNESVIDENLISAKTRELLRLLADFLENYSDNTTYNSLLEKLHGDPILKDYFGLTELDIKAVTTKKTAKHLASTIKKGEHVIHLPPSATVPLLEPKTHVPSATQHSIQPDNNIPIKHDDLEGISNTKEGFSDVDTIQGAVEAYIAYHEQKRSEGRGVRGITRFSHFHHGSSGISRTKELLEFIQKEKPQHDDSNEVKEQFLMKLSEKLNKACKASSTTYHSLNNYLNQAFGDSGKTIEEKVEASIQNKSAVEKFRR